MSIHYQALGKPIEQASHVLVWGHGWGQRGACFLALCQAFPHCAHILLDFPGFGQSPAPDSVWSTGDYAEACASLIQEISPNKPVLWVGHSFGGRVGLQLGARHPALLKGLYLVASAGLPRRRSLAQKIKLWTRIRLFKMVRGLADRVPLAFIEKMKNRLGSSDYQKAGVMRPIFVKVVNENLTDVAQRVRCPVILVYGANDTETPPEIGERLAALIPGAELVLLPGQDHYSVLGEGRQIVIKRLQAFMDRL